MRKPATRNRTFQSHGAGKGCSDRTSDDKAYRENWDNIDWNRPVEKKVRITVTTTTTTKSSPYWDDELSSAGAHPIGFASWEGYYRAIDRRGKE